MEENILNGTEYILSAINSISNYQDFQQYKPEILKAILDIKETILNSLKEKQQNFELQQNNYLQKNLNLNQNYNRNNNYSISNTLGLRYNYDAYLNTDSVKNSLKNTISESDNQQNYEFQNMNYDNDYENNQNFQNENNLNNIISNIPLEQNYNFQQMQNYYEQNNNNDNMMNIQNENNDNYNNEGNNIILNQNQNQNNIDMIDKKKQISKVADLVMKINNDDGIYEILSKLFGEDLIDKLISRKDEKFILGVEEAIKEIEELRRKDEELEKLNSKKNTTNNPLFYESGENPILSNNNTIENNNSITINNKNNKNILNKKKSYADELLMKHGLLNTNSSTGTLTNKSIKISKMIRNDSEKSDRKNEPYKEFSFENSLRIGMKKKNNIRSNSSYNNGKKFNNYTSGYGHYFDESLQNGGVSKLSSYKQKGNYGSKKNLFRGND